ncbi:hypothetical protein, partial [Brevibacillus brevis]|uniref:hypothetical protein n=1 Tax=Brevibacillus brevis TaxID=1393 RepID=UPI0037C7AE8F
MLFPTVNNKNLAWQGYAQNGCRTLHFLLAKYKIHLISVGIGKYFTIFYGILKQILRLLK